MATFCLVFLKFTELQAGTVRTVYSDGVTMLPVSLRMGQSTVLRFSEKPKKVVLGNSNYYSVEFIENDLAIQPLGSATTNLFVYGLKNVYGFILRTNQTTSYDDLVQVDLKENKLNPQSKPVIKASFLREVSRPKLVFQLTDDLKLTLTKVLSSEKKDFYVMDLLIENISKAEVDLSKLEINIYQGKNKISPQEVIFMETKIKSSGMTAARVFVSIEKCSDLVLEARIKNLKIRQIILKRFL